MDNGNKALWAIGVAVVVGMIAFFTYHSVNCIHIFSTFCAVTPK